MMQPIRPIVLGLAVLTAGCQRPAPPSASSAPFAAKLDSAMSVAMAAREMPGASIVVVQGDKVTYQRGFGKADLASGRPMTDSTPIVIGSTSKPITALAVLRMVQIGKLALDTPIVRYVPEIQFKDPRGATMTLRHLLTNRAGLPSGFSGPAYRRPSIVDDAALERLSKQMTTLPLLFAPGEGYTYSNRGWSLAAYVVQRVSGIPIEEFVKREVFEPVGMKSTTLEFWKVPDLVTGYVEGRQVRNHPMQPSVAREYSPSGMVVSTGRDLARLLIAMMNGGRTEAGTQFLTPELIAEAQRAQAEATSELGGPTQYGLGWEVDSTFGTHTVKKAGSVHSMVTLLVMLPQQKTAVVFAFNREDYKMIPIVPTVLSIVAGGEGQPLPDAPMPPAPAAPVAAKVAAAAIDRWLGEYDTSDGNVYITRKGDTLIAEYDGAESVVIATSDSTLALTGDILTNEGKVLTFRKRGAATTLWIDRDSLGIKVR